MEKKSFNLRFGDRYRDIHMDDYIEAFSSGIYVFVKEADLIEVKSEMEYNYHGRKHICIKKNKEKKSRIIEADLIPSKSKGKQQQESYRVAVCDFNRAFSYEFHIKDICDNDEKRLKVAEFFYEQWEGKNELCKNHDLIYTCKSCQSHIKDLKNAIPWEDYSGLYFEKLFVWILLNKKEWMRPKIYFRSWIRFLIVNACSSIERLLANKILDYNEFSGIENTLMSTVETYASPICDIIIGGLSTELEPSYERLGITPDKQNKDRINQSLKVWFDEVSKEKDPNVSKENDSLEEFLQRMILGAKTFHPQLNGLVYSLLLDIWRGEYGEGSIPSKWLDWSVWVKEIESWKASPETISKPLEPNVKPVCKGNVLCCSTPVPYQLSVPGNEANSKNKSVSFYPALLWHTQHCPNCNNLMSGGVLKPSIWLQGARIETRTKPCQKSRIKLDSWTCGKCNNPECKCANCVTVNGKGCKKCSVCKACACAIDNCNCDVKVKCACKKCEMSFFSSTSKADSHIFILTKGKQNISCPLGEAHTTDGPKGGRGITTSKVFIDVNNFSDCMDGILATTSTYEDLCKLLKKCGFNKDQFEPLVQIKLKAYSEILIDNKYRLPKSNTSLNNLFKNLEKAIEEPSVASTKDLFYHYKALSNVISTFGTVLADLYKDLCQLIGNYDLNNGEIDLPLQIKVKTYSQILTDNKGRLTKSEPDLCILFKNLEKAIKQRSVASTQDLFNHYKALNKVISTFEWVFKDLEIGSIPIFHKR